MPDRATRLRRLAVWIWSVVAAVLLLMPVSEELPGGGVWDWLDKPAHLLLFAIHCGLLFRWLASSLPPGRAVAVAAALSSVYAVLLEALQLRVPGRDWEWWDVVADLAGIALAALLLGRSRARLRRTP